MIEKTKKLYDINQSVFAVAPMLDWTDRHCRAFHRVLSKNSLLYTEMVTTGALIHGDRDRHLRFSKDEQPVACQLGGSDPKALAECAKMVEDWGYDEVNLNVGCPSDRVQSGKFGACLMLEPELVAEGIAAMKDVVSIPVTTKCRIGVDAQEPEEALNALADKVIAAGTDALWVHARKAWLKGLSPKENRDVPPLDYDLVYRLKQRLPDVFIGVNGGVATLEETSAHLEMLDGVMMGRAAYQNPMLLAEVDRVVYGKETAAISPVEAMDLYRSYIEDELSAGTKLASITRHILGTYQGVPGARHFRRIMTVDANKTGAGIEVLEDALAAVLHHQSVMREAREQKEAALI
ncbi:putative tRNA-dihydrouridine synthase [Pseudovibrio sp. W64]|uniref:tRNA dihydrouridine(20/20a) synthase DusA n=1 Tax=unclassified Pseudovibrio TaxID=2627060 RepID=UPI0007AEA370|nr:MULTISPECIES: tRNA dihydrouridine(20/20a) synthase DusA [unclassified Pseudovibrio]KZK81821.1 putative tRNA-dihydrouridine synthase [Pseudovibrio sp. W64]KZK83294.1 putative tRNA-dihydrouridine synthase [Pseudovibrio sp. Ad13]KZL11357.1 putative tRNA-dihydrouridine synthase [Pseudovibrio sp. Ad26]